MARKIRYLNRLARNYEETVEDKRYLINKDELVNLAARAHGREFGKKVLKKFPSSFYTDEAVKEMHKIVRKMKLDISKEDLHSSWEDEIYENLSPLKRWVKGHKEQKHAETLKKHISSLN